LEVKKWKWIKLRQCLILILKTGSIAMNKLQQLLIGSAQRVEWDADDSKEYSVLSIRSTRIFCFGMVLIGFLLGVLVEACGVKMTWQVGLCEGAVIAIIVAIIIKTTDHILWCIDRTEYDEKGNKL
jgi:hypothetical protein